MILLKKFNKFARDLWLIIGISLLIFVVMDVSFWLAFQVRDKWRSPVPYWGYRVKADTYVDASWVASYWEEFETKLGKLRWEPYVYARRTPYQGEYINISLDGIRKTYSVTASEGMKPTKRIFMFGGSTMWGSGARDDCTIPSFFVKETKKKGINCEAVNFGEHGYVSTQEVIELMLQLQKGNIPDAVIFYDGVNDTFAAFQSHVAGLPHNEFNREKEFNLLERRELKTYAIQYAVRQLSTIRFLNGLLKKLENSDESNTFQPLEYVRPISNRELLVREVVETYLSNVTLIRALSKSYGFKCIFYWQPLIYQKKQLTEYERRAIELEFNYPGMREFYLETYAYLNQHAALFKNDSGFYDISLMFNDTTEPLFIDFCHLGERGNNLIAQRMVEDFYNLL